MIPQLHDVLTLTRPLVGLDEETTGVNPRTSAICELGLEIFAPQPDGTVRVKEYRTLVNPLLPIPKEASAIHGISNDMVRDAPTFVQLAANLYEGMNGCDFVGYNVRFDLRQLAEEFARAGYAWRYDDACVLDGLRLWQLAEGRKLTDAVDRWLGSRFEASENLELENLRDDGQAHNALWDVKMSTRVVAAQLQACTRLPRDLRQLHELCWPGWFDAEGKLKWLKGELCFTFGEHRDKPLRHVPQGYLRWVAGRDFSETVKQACRNAAKGIFPTPPLDVEAIDADD